MARFVPIVVLLVACGSPPGQAEGEGAGSGTSGAEAEAVPDPPAAPSAAEMLAAMEPAAIDPTDHDRIREIAGASAPRVFFLAQIPLIAASGRLQRDEGEAGCPSVVTEGEVMTLRGGCVDEEGTRWTGEAVLRGMRGGERAGSATYRVFGFQKRVECDGGPQRSEWQANGSLVVEPDGEGLRFTIDLSFQGGGVDQECRPMEGTGALQYSGRQLQSGEATRWSGSGHYGWRGFGKVEASTEDELVNQRNCRHEALMGSTTVRSAGHEVSFRYDGESDCSEEATTPWSFDGEPQGELSKVGCSAAGGGAGPLAPWLLAPLLLLATRARRPSRRTPTR